MSGNDVDEEIGDDEDWDLLVRAWRGRQSTHPGWIEGRLESHGELDLPGDRRETPVKENGK